MRSLLLALTLCAAPSLADVTYQIGPTLPFALLDLDSQASPWQVLPGAGAQLSISDTRFQRELFGKNWDMLDIIGMGFGTVVSHNPDPQFGRFSAAAGVGTLNSLVSVVVGKHILDSNNGFTGRHGWFLGLMLSLNFGVEPPAATAASSTSALSASRAEVVQPKEVTRRGNTIYW